jgi:diguanylate cyclase (GGDEF)-like protein/PAS domain S-box-containing protein
MSKSIQAAVAVWLAIAASVVYLISGLVSSRQTLERRIRDQAVSYTRLVEQHASAAFDRASMALAEIIDHLSPPDLDGSRGAAGRTEIDALLLNKQRRAPGVVGTFLTDARGDVLFHSLGNPSAISLRDRGYFQRLKEEPNVGPVISEAVSGRMTGQWGIQVARRLDLPDGSFGGVVGATLGLSVTFEEFYATLPLGRNSTVSLRDLDSRLVVRYPILTERLGKEVGVGGLRDHFVRREPEGVVTAVSDMDGLERLFGFRKLARYPIYAVVGLSMDDALSGWRRERKEIVIGSALLILAGAFITLVLNRMRRAEAWLRTASLYTRSLIEASLDPLVTIDDGGRITDVNQAAVDVTGLRREELAGTDYASYFTDPARAREGHERAFSGGVVTDYSLTIRHRDGHLTDVFCNATVYRGEAGEVLGVLSASRDVTEHTRAEQELNRLHKLLEEQAVRDPLTGLFNRRYLDETIGRELSEADRRNYPVSFIMIDIDRFKELNDTHGHRAGDLMLQAVSHELQERSRGGDIACRYGGEEFLLIMPRASAEIAAERTEQWRQVVEALRVHYGTADLRVTISAGVAEYPADGRGGDAVISRADAALYVAKAEGRNRVSVAGDGQE